MSEGWGAPQYYEDDDDLYDDSSYGGYDEDDYLARLQAERDELAEIDYLENQIAAKAYENQLTEQALEYRAVREAQQEAYEQELYEDALEAQDEQESKWGEEVEQAERLFGERFNPEQIDYVMALKQPDEHFGEAVERLLSARDWSDPQVRREQLAAEIEIDRMEREVDQADDDAELPPEAVQELHPEEAEELSDWRAEAIAERRAFERNRRPLTDEEAAEFTENVLDAREAGNTSYTLHEAEEDSFVGPPPDMRNPDARRHNMAEILAEEMANNNEWGRDEQANWQDRHPDSGDD